MAVYFKGMSSAELATFTESMLHSGSVIDLSHIEMLKVDKHSTGGVGDKISLPLAPAVAACGVPVPMVSGRGLGHTGGTLDKLESIPGFRVDLDVADYKRLVGTIGCCLIGQTGEVAPADKKLYALRDVTATVDCIPLIASSIMSKKLAEGIDALVLDVKVGSGAFMKTLDEARDLAKTMVGIGNHMGKKVVARITNMDQPLGRMIGNSLEVMESIEVLSGRGPQDVIDLTVELGAEMLVAGAQATDIEMGRERMKQALNDGSGLKKFAEIIEAQGGDPRVVKDLSLLPLSEKTETIKATQDGYLASVNTEKVGIASMVLGGGRQKASDQVDPSVGIEMMVRIGDAVTQGQPLAKIYHQEKGVAQCLEGLREALSFQSSAVPVPQLFIERIDKGHA
jgi:pyrimidine-nucleoside phosphorylase